MQSYRVHGCGDIRDIREASRCAFVQCFVHFRYITPSEGREQMEAPRTVEAKAAEL